jgi:hypothetical protein
VSWKVCVGRLKTVGGKMSVTQTAERPKMAKRRPGKPALESVKLPADVMESARIVAAYTGEAISDMLGEMLRPILAKREREEAAKRAKTRGEN